MSKHYFCGVPPSECSGTYCDTSARAGEATKQKSAKMHTERDQAFDCHVRYLVRRGYARIGQREFASPNDGPVLVLSKRSHFGQELKKGKGGEGSHGNRFMPKRPNCCII